MLSRVTTISFLILDFAALILFDLRAYSFCNSLLGMSASHRLAKPASLLTNCLVLAAIFLFRPPMLLGYILVYLVILLEFCMIFQGKILAFLFGSGNFMFHLMVVQMMVTAIYVLMYQITSKEAFLQHYPSAFFLSLLLVIVFLEIFQRSVDRQALQLLLKNDGQLLFATTSMMFINIYLILLSVSYSGQAYSPVAATFLLCTGFLLFGAFYTAFQHAVRMSMLLEYREKSRMLEDELEKSYEHLAVVQTAATTDALTKVHNRRCGLEALSRLLESGRRSCVCFLDMDHLKAVNDQFGHEEGDRYILRVVQALTAVMSGEDTLARLGGDEFLLLLPGVSQEDALKRLERVRVRLSAAASSYRSSISYGVVQVDPESRMTVQEALDQADMKMYEYKVSHGQGRPAQA